MDRRTRLDGSIRDHPPTSALDTGVCVLYIDDEPGFADRTATFLERENDNFDVITETDPGTGLDRLRDADVDCVVSGYEMSGMDGLEVFRAVRNDYPELLFFLFFGTDRDEIASEAISAGVTDCLQKDGSSGQYTILANRIENAVVRRRIERLVGRGYAAIEAAHTGIGLLNGNGEFIYVNPEFAALTGYDREGLLGERWTVLYRDADRAEVCSEMLPRAREGEWTGQTPYVRKNGETVIVDQTLTYADDGTLVCTISEADASTMCREPSLKGQAMDEAPVGIILTDPSKADNPIVYANDRFVELTGYSRDEILGRAYQFLRGPDTRDEPIAEMRTAIEAGESVTVELRNYRKDGEMFWNRVSISPLRDQTDEVQNYVSFQRDVSEYKEQERALREEQAFIEQSIETLDDLFYVLDSDGKLKRWNGALPEVTGYTDEELAEMRGLDFFDGGDRDRIATAIAETFETGGTKVEAELVTNDGERIPYEFTGTRLTSPDGDGERRGVIGIGRDVTERKAYERKLRRLHQTTRELLEADTPEQMAESVTEAADEILDFTMNGIHLYDEDAGGLAPAAVSEGSASMFDELPVLDGGIAWEAFESGDSRIHDDVRDADAVYNPDTPMRSEMHLPLGDHGVFIVSSTERAAFDGVDITLAKLLAANVESALDRTEQEIELVRKAERLDKFTDVVSHDLQSPLNVAKGHLQIERDQRDSDRLASVADALDRMEAMIDDTLTLARQGETVGEMEPIDLSSLVTQCWGRVRTFDATLEIADDIAIDGDPNRLQHVFENLFQNAVEHGGENVTVRIGSLDEGGFYVEDDGTGIPEENRRHLFERGSSSSDDGTGFGLAIVSEIVEAHGWKIHATESDAGGARFEITSVHTK